MFNKLNFVLLLIVSAFIISCSPKHSEIVLAEFGNHEIKMNEFEEAYAKNVGSIEEAKKDSIKELSKFLDLYVNFKMKLRDAKVRGLDKEATIIDELETYKSSIGVAYYLEKELYEKGIKDLYEKRKSELRVSHLLIRTDQISEEEAQTKAVEILERIKNGASFEEEVLAHSDDTFSKSNGGDIYYITAGTILPPFENIAYNTPVGTVNPTPLKTQYGYHLIKVTDKKERIPQIQASHILIGKNQVKSDSLSLVNLDLANNILLRIKSGEDFGKLAQQYSEDPGSKENGGELGYFARRQMVQEFDAAAFNLEVGEVSDIVETKFGYHIIKLTDKKEYPSYAEEKNSLREIYEKSRKKDDFDNLLKKIEKEQNVAVLDDNLKQLIAKSDSTVMNDSYWQSEYQKEFGNKVLLTIGSKSFDLDSLVSYTMLDPKSTNRVLSGPTITSSFTKFKEDKIIEAQALKELKNDSNFNSLMQEYQNGILIFKLQESEVWNKMKMDSLAIHKLYEDTKDSYILPSRVKFKELFANSDSVINSYMNELKNGKSFDSLMVRSGNKDRVETKPYKNELKEVGDNALAKTAFELNKEGSYSEIIKHDKGFSILQLIEKDASRIKTFDEARAEVTSRYQDVESAQLENKYVSNLKGTYNPKLFYEELKNAFKE